MIFICLSLHLEAFFIVSKHILSTFHGFVASMLGDVIAEARRSPLQRPEEPATPFKYKEVSKCAVGSKTRNEAKGKAKKVTNIEEIRAELRGTMGERLHTIIDEEEGDEDVYMFPANMQPNERDEYRKVVRASKASECSRG